MSPEESLPVPKKEEVKQKEFPKNDHGNNEEEKAGGKEKKRKHPKSRKSSNLVLPKRIVSSGNQFLSNTESNRTSQELIASISNHIKDEVN